MAMLIYICSQIVLIVLWILTWMFWFRDPSRQVRSSYPKADPWPGASIAWYVLFCIGVSGAFVMGIFGTGKRGLSMKFHVRPETALIHRLRSVLVDGALSQLSLPRSRT